MFVIGAVIGGMYTGWATPTEVGALGAFIVFVMALLKRSLTGRGLLDSLLDTVKLTVMIFSIIWGVLIFVRFLAFAGVSSSFSDWIAIGVSPYLVLLFVIVLYTVLGIVHGRHRHAASHPAGHLPGDDEARLRPHGSASSS